MSCFLEGPFGSPVSFMPCACYMALCNQRKEAPAALVHASNLPLSMETPIIRPGRREEEKRRETINRYRVQQHAALKASPVCIAEFLPETTRASLGPQTTNPQVILVLFCSTSYAIWTSRGALPLFRPSFFPLRAASERGEEGPRKIGQFVLFSRCQ